MKRLASPNSIVKANNTKKDTKKDTKEGSIFNKDTKKLLGLTAIAHLVPLAVFGTLKFMNEMARINAARMGVRRFHAPGIIRGGDVIRDGNNNNNNNSNNSNNNKKLKLLQKISKDLNNKGVTNYKELMNYAKKNIPKFKGIYFTDHLPKTLKPGESLIQNLDKINNAGTHWLSMIRSHNPSNTIYHYDSYGQLPTESAQRLAERSNCNLAYFDNQFQTFKESNCGQRSIEFLMLMNGIGLNSKHSMQDIAKSIGRL